MKITKATFIKSSTKLEQLPPHNLPEYAFIGRSNVGKSSLINMLADNFKLAQTSGRPGKTQTINHFLINENWYLVDLPGYGWARISKTMRVEWKAMIDNYLLGRENLMCIFVLIDVRIPPQKIDLEFITYLAASGLPFNLIFTKADKESGVVNDKSIAAFKREMLKTFEECPEVFLTSSETKYGKAKVLDYIGRLNELFVVPPKKQQEEVE